MNSSIQTDSQRLFYNIIKNANFSEEQQSNISQRFESALFTQTLHALLELLPEDQRKKMHSTMHFQPEFFLERSLAILQSFASSKQIVDILDQISEKAFLDFFENLLKDCDEEQKTKINAYLQQF